MTLGEMRVHMVAVAGTGMGSLAGLLAAQGHQVTGSDTSFYPPMGPALERWGITRMVGFDPRHLDEAAPDLVVVGNVCRSNNPEARAALDRGLRVTSMVGALGELVLPGTRPLVVGGTHGKTTTSSLCAWLLDAAGQQPGFLIGGIPDNFGRGFRPPRADDRERQLPVAGGSSLAGGPPAGGPPPFVIEGDEYDSAFFEKTPKFWHYQPQVAVLTSMEHDHIDIYPDEASYRAAFEGFVARVDPAGLIVVHAGDEPLTELVRAHARARVLRYGLQGEAHGDEDPDWLGAAAPDDHGSQSMDVFASGTALGRARLPLSGAHNLRNALAAVAAVSEGYGVPANEAMAALRRFSGVARRQQLVGEAAGVRIYDDFGHHPTAVRETLAGLRRRHPGGALWAVYEARSATACRSLHQQRYLTAFDAADRVVLAPLGRSRIPEAERLDLSQLAAGLNDRGLRAERAASIDAIIERLVAETHAADTVVLLSNGAFGGIHQRLLDALGRRG